MFRTIIAPTSLFALLFSVQAAAQDLHIYYDAFRDSLWFINNGKTIQAPYVRTGKQIIYHVDNYNNYLYNIQLNVENKAVEVAQANPMTGLNAMPAAPTSGTGGLGMIFSQSGTDKMEMMNIFPSIISALTRESGFAKEDMSAETAERITKLKKIEGDFTSARERIFTLEADLKDLEVKAENKALVNRVQSFAAAQIASIRYNPNLEPRQIKTLTTEYMSRIFEESDPNKISLEKVLSLADLKSEMPRIIKEYTEKTERYIGETAICDVLVGEFNKLAFPDPVMDRFSQKAAEFLKAVRERTAAFRENAKAMEAQAAKMNNLDPEMLAALRTTYLELNNNKFSKNWYHRAAGEQMTFSLKLIPVDSIKYPGLATRHVSPVAVDIAGGIQVKASVGFNFGQYFSRPQNYYVRGDKIQADDAGAVSPTLTSFVHFYTQHPRTVSLAGSFGMGFPLSGGESFQSVSFFLGPSIVFGKSRRIVLNTGLTAGKVERLAAGYKVGDEFFSDSNTPPLRTVYELGYFFGVSFNVTGGG